MKNVKLIFDRRKTVAKTGTGFIDICVYLKAGQRKYEIVGTAKPEDWEAVAQGKEIMAKVKHYEQIISAMKVLDEDNRQNQSRVRFRNNRPRLTAIHQAGWSRARRRVQGQHQT